MHRRRTRGDHAACSGCGLCLLVCPVWRRTRDIRFTPHGRAKALQQGADLGELAASIESCTLCAACEPACPEEIDLIAMTTGLRRQLARLAPPVAIGSSGSANEVQPGPRAERGAASRRRPRSVLLPGSTLRERPGTLSRVAVLLGEAGAIAIGDDDGQDIAMAIETGAEIPPARLEQFLAPLRGIHTLIVAEGILLRHLRQWMPRARAIGLGEALSRVPAVRAGLRATDMYVIEPRAYHADYRRLVNYYDGLRSEHDCAFNLDLQRIAIPATARSLRQRLGLEAADDGGQVQWILQGRRIARVVAESAEDAAAFAQFAAEHAMDCPVVHLAEVAGGGAP